MNIFNQRKLTNLRLLGGLKVELTYNDGTQGTYSNILWSVNVDPDSVSGSVHLSQGGAVGGIGFFGTRVSPTEPIVLDGVTKTSIQDVENYFLASAN